MNTQCCKAHLPPESTLSSSNSIAATNSASPLMWSECSCWVLDQPASHADAWKLFVYPAPNHSHLSQQPASYLADGVVSVRLYIKKSSCAGRGRGGVAADIQL